MRGLPLLDGDVSRVVEKSAMDDREVSRHRDLKGQSFSCGLVECEDEDGVLLSVVIDSDMGFLD